MQLICVGFCKDMGIRNWTEIGARKGGQHVWCIVKHCAGLGQMDDFLT